MARPRKYIYSQKDLDAGITAAMRGVEARYVARVTEIRDERDKLRTEARILNTRHTDHERKLVAQDKLILHWQTRAKKWRMMFLDMTTLEDAVTDEGQNVPFDVANTTHR